MVQLKRRWKRKVKRKSPSGKAIVFYKRRKPSHAVCALCGSKLGGVPKGRPSEIGKLSLTEKRPERLFGGVLCHACCETVLKEKTRLTEGVVSEKDLDLLHLKYIKMLR
ncbi:50S ribosomal protein L34e [Candidatus Micrarchaeota archaeon]|nr:50S ribosomal protein L34e [Candidatus Micrarchaeota archaeon]